MKYKIYIVEDHALVQEALRLLITGEKDLEVCGVAGEAYEALDAIPAAHPDVVLIDLALPGMNGLELIKELVAADPGRKMIIFTGHTEAPYVKQGLAAGAMGFISKERPSNVIDGIRSVLAGEKYITTTRHDVTL